MAFTLPSAFRTKNRPDMDSAVRGTVAMERMERAARTRVRQKAGVLLLTPLLGLLVAAVRVHARPPMYEAVGRVRLVPSSLQATPEPGLPPGYLYYGPDVVRHNARADELQLLTSNTFLRGVAARLPPAAQQRLLDGEPLGDYTPAELSDALLAELSGSLVIEADTADELFEISFLHTDRELAAMIVNTLIQDARQVGLRLALARTDRAATFFAGQIGSLERSIREAQQHEDAIDRQAGAGRREALHRAGGQYVFEYGGGEQDAELNGLRSAAANAHLQQRLAEGKVQLLRALGKDDDLAAETSPSLVQLRATLHQAEAEYAELEASLGPASPAMRGRAAAIASLRKDLSDASLQRLNLAQAQATSHRRAAESLDREADQHLRTLREYQKDEVKDAMLDLELALNLSVYEDIEAQLQAAKINGCLGATDLQVIDQAPVPQQPLPRGQYLQILAGLAVGLTVGAVLAIYLVDRGRLLWTVTELESRTALPVLAVLTQQPAGSLGGGTTALPEYEDALRTLANELRLLPESFAGRMGPHGRQGQVLLFTSASPAEGKTASACGYASLLARQGVRTLLLDADLHRPAVHRFFGFSGRVGVSSVLQDRATFADALLHPNHTPGLDVMAAGPVSPSPSGLLGLHAFKLLLEQARETYQAIVIDTPPVLALMDAVNLSREADLVLTVTRYGAVSLGQAARVSEVLGRADAPLGGLIVNGAPQR